jgi:ABC-type sugar transport system permease subunit
MEPQKSEHVPGTPVQTTRKKVAPRTKVALWLIIAPTILIIVSFIGFAVTNFAFAGTSNESLTQCDSSQYSNPETINIACKEQLFGEPSSAQTITNVILFITTGLGIITWLPGLIIGFVLLATRPRQPAGQ